MTEVASGRHWTAVDFRCQILARAARYEALGMEAGDRIIIQHGNSLEFFADLLAVWTIGACAIPVDEKLTAFEVGRIAEVTRAGLRIIDATSRGDASASSGLVTLLTRDIDASAGPAASTDRRMFRLDDDALILFTSGSTGEPKGVVHTHRSLLARWTSLEASVGSVGDLARTLCFLPTNFGHGLICNCLFPWLLGCHVFLAPPARPDILMGLGRLIDQHRISFLSSVPSAWQLPLRIGGQPEMGSLRRIHVGSAPLSASLWSQIREWAGIRAVYNTYGITEVASWTAGLRSDDFSPESGLVGQPWGASIMISPARNTEALPGSPQCAADEEGMIWLNTPSVMRAYYNSESQTDAAMRDGWFMTGDIGAVDARGLLYLTGRERDEINKGGLKIAPAAIDAAVAGCSGVIDVCAFPIEDKAYGENVGMALVLDDRGPASLRRVHQWLAARLAPNKQPLSWFLLDRLPRSDRGKLDRKTVQALCARQPPVDLSELLKN